MPGKHLRPPRWTWRKIWKVCFVTIATALVSTLVAEGVSQLFGPQHVIVAPAAKGSPALRAGGRRVTDRRHRLRPAPPAQSAGQALLHPLNLISEDPVDPSVEWMFSGRLTFSGQQQEQLDYEIDADQMSALNNYFFAGDGYAPSAHTLLVLRNADVRTVEISNLQIIKDCEPPVNGSLINVTGLSGASQTGPEGGIPLGYDLDQQSPDAEANTVTSQDPQGWEPGYFLSHSVPVQPGRFVAFNIEVVASNAACSFWYKITVIDGAIKDRETIGDGNGPFRVSAFSQTYPRTSHQSNGGGYAGYGEVYLGGTASPLPNGALALDAPATTPRKR